MRRILKRFTEWGISLKFKGLKALTSKLWFNVFIRVALIFAAFVLVLTLCNVAMLSRFFAFRQKSALITQVKRVDRVDIDDVDAVTELLVDIRENHNFNVEIYDSNGRTRYTTQGAQMMNFFNNGRGDLEIRHEELVVKKQEKLSDGIVYEEGESRFSGEKYLLCRKQIDENLFVEVRIQKQLIEASATTANEFIAVISLICLFVSLIWVVVFARRFSKPIAQMNEITRDMADLKFDRSIAVDRNDEIGRLAMSINEMSVSLSSTLDNLNKTNAKLRDEIELERQLDKMRKTFVANVSHELKTPISIISGYAEGLKLNVNAENREDYCDTIIDESARMNTLVLSILELSKYESGQLPAQKANFDLFDLSSILCERIFAHSDLILENKILQNTVVYADSLQIEQALKAYLENAKSHTESGGTVTLFVTQENGKLIVHVHNTGSHIPPDKMPLIWQSFYRGDDSHKRDKTRFGLGLSIVNAVANIHGNRCGVYNTETGVGFWIELDKGQ